MIGVLAKFLEFMKIEADKINSTATNTQNAAKESSQTIERDEKDNVFSEKSEIITKFENGKVVQINIITQTIPISKTTAMRKTITQRIR